VAVCDADKVTFVNYPISNCQGTPSNYSKPLGDCQTELLVMSWNAGCNATNIWYNNFLGTSCSGDSKLTRTYDTNVCRNCNNAECKDGPFSKFLSWIHLWSAARVAKAVATPTSVVAPATAAPSATETVAASETAAAPASASASASASAAPLLATRAFGGWQGGYVSSCRNCNLSKRPMTGTATVLSCDCRKPDNSYARSSTDLNVGVCVDGDGHFVAHNQGGRCDVMRSSPNVDFSLQGNGDVVIQGDLVNNHGGYTRNQRINANTFISNSNGLLVYS
jgi:hypothetical protein